MMKVFYTITWSLTKLHPTPQSKPVGLCKSIPVNPLTLNYSQVVPEMLRKKLVSPDEVLRGSDFYIFRNGKNYLEREEEETL